MCEREKTKTRTLLQTLKQLLLLLEEADLVLVHHDAVEEALLDKCLGEELVLLAEAQAQKQGSN